MLVYLFLGRWRRQETHDDSHNDRQPKQQHGEVHVVDILENRRAVVFLSARLRSTVDKYEYQARYAGNQSRHETPEGTLKVYVMCVMV